MGLTLMNRYSIGAVSINKDTFRRAGLWVMAVTLALTAIVRIPPSQAHADTPLYGQPSTATFGDRRVAHYAGGIALDSAGNFFIGVGATNDNYIRKFAADGTFIKDFRISDTTGNSDIAYTAQYGRMAVDSNDLLYAINKNDSTIHVFDDNGVLQTVIASAIANADIIFDHSNNYYMNDIANNRVRKYAHDGTFLYNIGGPTSGTADGQFNRPGEMAIDSNNNLVVIDKNNNRIQIFSSTGSFIRKFGQLNTALLCPAQPSLGGMAGLVVDQQDNIYVATHAAWCDNHVQKFTITGTYVETQTRPRGTSYMRLSPTNIIYDLESGSPAGYDSAARYDTNGAAIGGPLLSSATALARPTAVAQDSQGNTYIVDEANARVQKYDSNRNPLLTFGSYGSGTGQFQYIGDIAIDQNDIIYVTDRTGQKVQKFDTSGAFVGTFGVAGSGDGQFNGWATDIAVRPDGNIIVQDGNTRLQTFTPAGVFINKIAVTGIASFAQKSDGTITILAQSGYSNYLYDYSPSGTLISSRYNSFNNPGTNTYFTAVDNLAYDRFDNLYAVGKDTTRSRYYSSSIARLNLTDADLPGYSVIVADIDYLANPYFTPSNQLFATDYLHDYVSIYDTTAILQPPSAPANLTVAPSTPGTLILNWNAPASVPAPSLYRIEYSPHATGKWYKYATTTATNLTLSNLLDDTYDIRVSALNDAGAGSPAQVSNTRATNTYGFKQRIDSPNNSYATGITFDRNGNRYESDSNNNCINVFDASGTLSFSFGTYGSGDGEFSQPSQLTISSDDKLYVPDQYNNRVEVFSLDGTYLTSFGTYGSGDGQMNSPSQVYIDSSDTVYVVSQYDNIQKYDKNGTYLGRIAAGLSAPTGMTMDAAGNIYVANSSYDTEHGIYKYSPAGAQLAYFGSVGEADGQMYDIYNMIISPLGELVVSDVYNYRIVRFSTDGAYLGSLKGSYGDNGDYMTFDDPVAMSQSANGDIYLANSYSPYTNVFNLASNTPQTSTPPAAPSALAAATTTPNQINLTWNAPATDGGSPITSYQVEYKQSSQGASSWIATTVSGTALSYTLSNLPAVCHDIRVSAGNSDGYGVPASLSCVQVADAPATTPSVTPVLSTETTPSYQNKTTTPPAPTAPSASTEISATDSSAPPVSANPSATSNTPGKVTVTWQPPANESPTGYVVEYRTDTAAASDTTTPWRHAATTGADKHDAIISLPAGEYIIRVSALFPGEHPRIILGVAHISVAAYEAAMSSASNNPAPAKPSFLLLIVICIGLVMLAFFMFILIAWKRKRRKQAAQVTLPPRWQ